MGFEEPTPIQYHTIPLVREGRDVIGQAQTGTGKTASFGIPILERLDTDQEIQALVLTPTRELCIQVAEEISRLGRYLGARVLPVYGGQPIERQLRGLMRHPHILIGTPGRLLDHINRGGVRLQNVRTVVIDEADEMLDMGFIDDVKEILAHTGHDHQTLLFSATMPAPIRELAERFMHAPEWVAIQPQDVTVPVIEQFYVEVGQRQKVDALCRILDVDDPELAIIFCRTKMGVDELAEALIDRGYEAMALHGDLTQRERDRVMQSFRQGQIDLLVATDVAARGLDVSDVTHVINYDIPQDPDTYVHRIGRTGRAGKSGVAITLVTPREIKQLRTIERAIHKRIVRRPIPTVAELRERRQQLLVNEITETMESGDFGEYAGIAQSLLEQYDSSTLVAATLKRLAAAEQIDVTEPLPEIEEPPSFDFREEGRERGGRTRPSRSDMVRLFINVGRQDGIGPGDVVGAIANEAGIPGRLIGRIDLYDNFTFVEVPAEYESTVIDAMSTATIRGKEVNMEPARAGRGYEDRRRSEYTPHIPRRSGARRRDSWTN
ncbi:MAG: DEAD/DEAH box helicase [Firmicutes bacterium]|nr:DEAD/DEAH box helicase [Bacillota bacterium]